MANCEKCGKAMKNDNYSTCYPCTMEAKGFVKCPVCNWGYYDQEKYDKCYKCSNKEWLASRGE